MKKAYCDFCGKEILDEADLGGEAYAIPSVYNYVDEDDSHTEDLISREVIEDCCLSCCRRFDALVAELRKA